MRSILDDKRTEADKAVTIGFVVATDSFMSGWGKAPGCSYFAVPYRTPEEGSIVFENMQNRSEMRRVRFAAPDWRPKTREGDHVSIRAMDDVSRFYMRGGFTKEG